MTFNTELWNGGAPVPTEPRSLRFNSADSAHLSRTPGSAGNRKTFTLSFWIKRCALNTLNSYVCSAGASASVDRMGIYFPSDQFSFEFNPGGAGWNEITTSAVFRDTSAWYHFVVAFDSTQATSTNRVKIYVNGVQIPSTQLSSTDWPALNVDIAWNNNVYQAFGAYNLSGSTPVYSNCYYADVHNIDGLALGPGYFGEYDSNGVWQPKEFDDGGSTVNDGTQWSSLTSGGTVNASYPMSQTFDGSTSTAGVRAVSGGGFIFGGSLGISYSSGIRIHSGISGVGTQKFKLNDGSEVDFPENTWVTVVSGSGTLNKLEITAGTTGNAQLYLGAVEVDGVIMLDSTTTNLSYGTNGFNLTFGDNSGTSSTTLGKDAAGSNNWTPNNFSVTAGADDDSFYDYPTNGNPADDTGLGEEVKGNYATLNPLDSARTLSNGNLEYAGAASGIAKSSIAVSSGKWYWECQRQGAGNSGFGICAANEVPSISYLGATATSYAYTSAATKYNNGPATAYGATYSTTDIIGVALDLDAGTLTFYKNNISQGVAYSSLSGTFVPACGNNSTTDSGIFNFGQRAFAYQAPTGFRPLATPFLDTPTIEDGSAYMDVALYTGNGSTQTISGLGFSPDLVWMKSRSAGYNHYFLDIVRGVNQELNSNTTDTEYTRPAPGSLTSFNSDGFTLNSAGYTNNSGTTFAAWCWDAGSSTVSNTDGSITSSVRANTSAGFSVITATTPSQTTNYSVGHGLGVTPEFYIWKFRAVASNWMVYHKSIAPYVLNLNTTNAQYTGFNMPAPSSTLINLLDSPTAAWNSPFVIYAFAPVAGYSAFGSYTGNGSTDGPFVFTNFRPRYLLIKASSAAGTWIVRDTARDLYNSGTSAKLAPNYSYEENNTSFIGTPSQTLADFLSNGFKVRSTGGISNDSGVTYIYAAFAENPFKYARAR